MRKIYSVASVDTELCAGDKFCENLCVSQAIRVVKKKAIVDEDRCVNCLRCMDVCPTQAISMKRREEPAIHGVNPADVDPELVQQLCKKANLSPEKLACVCTFTTAGEVAAAVLKGAKTPDDVTLMTGARSSCAIWCIGPILRLLNAHWEDLPESDNQRWYNIKTDLWHTDPEVDELYPEYKLEEDKELFKKGIFHNLVGG